MTRILLSGRHWYKNNIVLFLLHFNTIRTIKGFLLHGFSFQTTYNNLPRGTYNVHGWMRIDPGREMISANGTIKIVLRSKRDSLLESEIVAGSSVSSEFWAKIKGGFMLSSEDNVTLHFGGLKSPLKILLAKFSITDLNSTAWRRRQNQRIERVSSENARFPHFLTFSIHDFPLFQL